MWRIHVSGSNIRFEDAMSIFLFEVENTGLREKLLNYTLPSFIDVFLSILVTLEVELQ